MTYYANIPAAEAESEDQKPLLPRRNLELQHQRDRQSKDDKVRKDIRSRCRERNQAVVDTRAALNLLVPEVRYRSALEDCDEHGRNPPAAHEEDDAEKSPLEPFLREDGAVEAGDAEFDKGHAGAVEGAGADV